MQNQKIVFDMMKKIIPCLLLAIAGVLASGCSSCNQKKEMVSENAATLVVENCVSTDREFMFTHYGGDYRWYESSILLKDYLDEDCDGIIDEVTDIFQVVTDSGRGYDTHVVMLGHSSDGKNTFDVIDGFWIDDFLLNDALIKLSFMDAFNKMQSANYPKPHSKHCVLRKQVGPHDCNPQYIFGNSKSQLFVDAVTGEVTDKNPVFGDLLSHPLGEWP